MSRRGLELVLRRRGRVRRRMITIDADALAGELEAIRGADLTAARSTCAACDASSPLPADSWAGQGRGLRARCERLIVLVTIRGVTCVDIGALAALEHEV
jgi:hypothetical protein